MDIPTLEEIASPDHLYQGWLRVRQNRGLRESNHFAYPSDIPRALRDISSRIIRGTYQPDPLLFVSIPSHKTGNLRSLSLPSIEDRVVLSTLSLLLTPALDSLFSECSFAFRPGRSIEMAQEAAVKIIQHRFSYVIRTDIKDCFDSIPFRIVEKRLLKVLNNSSLIHFIMKFVTAPLQKKHQLMNRRRGIPQGSPLSPLLCNLVLDVLDKKMIRSGFTHIRYADDLVLFGQSKQECREAYSYVKEVLRHADLYLNTKKTYGSSARRGFHFLGIKIILEDNQYHAPFAPTQRNPICSRTGNVSRYDQRTY